LDREGEPLKLILVDTLNHLPHFLYLVLLYAFLELVDRLRHGWRLLSRMVVKVLSGALMSQFIAERSIGGDFFRGSLSLLIDQAFKLQLLHFVIELHLLVLQPLWGGVPGFKVQLLLVVQLLSSLIVVVLGSLQRARGV